MLVAQVGDDGTMFLLSMAVNHIFFQGLKH